MWWLFWWCDSSAPKLESMIEKSILLTQKAFDGAEKRANKGIQGEQKLIKGECILRQSLEETGIFIAHYPRSGGRWARSCPHHPTQETWNCPSPSPSKLPLFCAFKWLQFLIYIQNAQFSSTRCPWVPTSNLPSAESTHFSPSHPFPGV